MKVHKETDIQALFWNKKKGDQDIYQLSSSQLKKRKVTW